MQETLLVDGYNVIFNWRELKILSEKVSLEASRHKLLEILSNYQGFKKNHIIVVFDGYYVKGNNGSSSKYNEIDVIFTKENETADEYIERLTYLNSKNMMNIRVVTSDALEQLTVMLKGARRISSREFLKEIELTNKSIKRIITKHKNYNRLEGRLDEDVIKWMEEMRRKK